MATKHAAMLAIVLAACAPPNRGFSDDEGDRAGGEAANGSNAASTNEPPSGAGVRGVATFTAADVARIALVLEQTAIEQARLAEEKGVTIEVKTYAARMIRERSEATTRLAAILARVTPRSEDPTPAIFERDVHRTTDALASLSRTEFELPYMTAEVATHARLLGLIDASLLPSATRAASRRLPDAAAQEIEQELVLLRAATSAHIVHALRVQGVLRAVDGPAGDGTEAGRRSDPASVANPAALP